MTPSKTYDASPTQSIVLEKSSNESVHSIVPESIISETETVQDIFEADQDALEHETISTENIPPENSRVSSVENSLEAAKESTGIPINTPTYEDIFHSSEDSSSSSSEDEPLEAPRVEASLEKPDRKTDMLPSKSNSFKNFKTSEDDEKVNFEKKLESLFKSNSLKTKVFEKQKIQKSNSESIIPQNEHLNKKRATRPKVRRPIRKRQNRNGRLLTGL